MQVIILEGENKTGKTTLANFLKDKYGFKYVKCSQPKRDPYVEYIEIIKKIARSTSDVVIDRFIYGEFVYGPLYRGKSALTYEQRRNLELKLLAVASEVKLIYCHDTIKRISERFEKENESFAKPNLIAKTLKLYQKEILDKRTEIPFQVIEHIMESEQDLLINKKLQALLENPIDVGNFFKDAIGNVLDPSLILVGESHNDEASKLYVKYSQPFDFGVSSKYLFEELKRSKISLKNVMLINSDSKELKKIKSYPCNIVALGRVAEEKLTALKIEHIVAGHPSYERRFLNKKHRLAKLFKSLT